MIYTKVSNSYLKIVVYLKILIHQGPPKLNRTSFDWIYFKKNNAAEQLCLWDLVIEYSF